MGWSLAASVVMAAVETGVQYASQSAAASAQNKLTSAYTMAQSQAIINNAINQYGQANQTEIATDAAARQKQMQENQQAGKVMGAATAKASSRGVTGISVDALQNQYKTQRDQYNSDVEYNRKISDNELQTQVQGIAANAQSQLNQTAAHTLEPGPSPFMALAQFGAASVNDYASYQKGRGTPPPSGAVPQAVDPNSGLFMTDPGIPVG